MVEQIVPVPGIAIVPVGSAGSSGLTPGDASSVEPRGMPVGEIDEPVVLPRGEVDSIVGVGAAMPLTCAMATPELASAGRTAATNRILVNVLRFTTWSQLRGFIDDPSQFFAMSITDIGQSLLSAVSTLGCDGSLP